MEYQELINLLENTSNQPTEIRTKSWVVKQMITGVKRIPLIVKLNLKL